MFGIDYAALSGLANLPTVTQGVALGFNTVPFQGDVLSNALGNTDKEQLSPEGVEMDKCTILSQSASTFALNRTILVTGLS